MVFSRYMSLYLMFFLIVLSSCKDTNEYRVDGAFVEYLLRFENEAAARQRIFDVHSTGLIIEFANLKDGNAGLTHFEDPIRIEIDRSYWDAISLKAGADLMKEDLIFHELGHGLLKRSHLNSTLENDEWKSIMCGGSKVNNRSWNINYRGLRKSYYIDELFNESTSAPEFSSIQLLSTVDTTGYKTQLYLSFDTENKQDAGFEIVKNTQYETSIDSARLKFQSFVDQNFMVFAKAPSPINIQYDFSFECTIEYRSTSWDAQYGLVFGTRVDASHPSAAESIEYLTINNNKRMFVGNRTWYSFYTELNKPNINRGGKNKLRIMKVGAMLYYFINNVYSYSTEIEALEFGNYFGFMVPARGTIYLDNFTISQKNSTPSAAKVRSNRLTDFQFVVEPTIMNAVKNK